MLGFFKKLGDIVAAPVRGLGRIARGKVREGLGDIAGTARIAAPFIPGVGLPLAMGIGAADDLLKGRGVGQTALNAGLQLGAAKLLAGGGGGALPAEKTPTPSLGKVGTEAVAGIENAGKMLPGVGPKAVAAKVGGFAPTAAKAAPVPSFSPEQATAAVLSAGAGATAPTGGGVLAGMTGFEKAQLGLEGVGALADIYGSYQMGKTEDRRLDMYEEDRARQIADDDRRRAAMTAAAKRLATDWRSY